MRSGGEGNVRCVNLYNGFRVCGDFVSSYPPFTQFDVLGNNNGEADSADFLPPAVTSWQDATPEQRERAEHTALMTIGHATASLYGHGVKWFVNNVLEPFVNGIQALHRAAETVQYIERYQIRGIAGIQSPNIRHLLSRDWRAASHLFSDLRLAEIGLHTMLRTLALHRYGIGFVEGDSEDDPIHYCLDEIAFRRNLPEFLYPFIMQVLEDLNDIRAFFENADVLTFFCIDSMNGNQCRATAPVLNHMGERNTGRTSVSSERIPLIRNVDNSCYYPANPMMMAEGE